MANTITITDPEPGAVVPSNYSYGGTYHLDDREKVRNFEIRCYLIFPPITGLPQSYTPGVPNTDPKIETWTATFSSPPQGVDATFRAELWINGLQADAAEVEDVDLANDIGHGPGKLGDFDFIR